MQNGKNKTALVTGGSSGIGRACAAALCGRGYTVYELSRRDAPILGIRHLTADITDREQVFAAVRQVEEECGSVDLLVSNAGFGISGPVEFTAPADAHHQIEVNLYGADNITCAVLPLMRRQGYGRIVYVSSLAAEFPLPFQTWYSVSKAALSAYALALQNEVRPYGISVCCIEPGDISSGFTEARKKEHLDEAPYGERLAHACAKFEKNEKNGMSSETAGQMIARYAAMDSSVPRIAIGAGSRMELFLKRLLPLRLVNRILYDIYAK